MTVTWHGIGTRIRCADGTRHRVLHRPPLLVVLEEQMSPLVSGLRKQQQLGGEGRTALV